MHSLLMLFLLNNTADLSYFVTFLLSGVFVCTDKDSNVILGSCHEYLKLPGIT